jgi:hypothetical protein
MTDQNEPIFKEIAADNERILIRIVSLNFQQPSSNLSALTVMNKEKPLFYSLRFHFSKVVYFNPSEIA